MHASTREVELAGGERIGFDKLLLASGAAPSGAVVLAEVLRRGLPKGQGGR